MGIREAGWSRKLEDVRRALARWRTEHGGPGRRIPEELWVAAAEVARGRVPETARLLRLDVDKLSLLASMGAEGIARRAADAGFVEMEGIEFGTAPTGGVSVELVGREGDRVRVEVRGGGVNVVELARAFWSRT